MDQEGFTKSASASVQAILGHKVQDGIIYFEVKSSVGGLLTIESLRRSEFIEKMNGFEAIEKYMNEDLTIPAKQALLNLDPLLILAID